MYRILNSVLEEIYSEKWKIDQEKNGYDYSQDAFEFLKRKLIYKMYGIRKIGSLISAKWQVWDIGYFMRFISKFGWIFIFK